MQLGPTTVHLADGVLTRRRQSFNARLLLFALGWLALSALTPAHAAGRPDLFNTSDLPAGDGATTEPGAIRARFIRVNSPVLASADSPLHQPAPAELNLESSRLELGLFNDIILTAALEKTVYRNGANFVATGVVDGWAESRVIIVAEGDVLAGTISVPGLGLYQIRYAGGGLHKIVEVDMDNFPGCKVVRKAPKNPRPIKLTKKKTKPIIGSEPGSFVELPPMMSFGGAFTAAGSPPAVNTNVDVMVVYTATARAGAGGVDAMNALIDLAVAEANDAYANSEIPITLNLVYRGEVTYTESGNAATDLGRLQNSGDGHMDGVHALRNQYGADLVCLFTETMQSTYAGLGFLMSNVSTNFSSYSFSVVRRLYATGNYTFAHELGHNMGCAHDRGNSSSQGAYPYSYGHRFVGSDLATYRTVMAYSPGTRIPYFSNPNVSYLGTPTGVAAGATNAADNASSITNTMPVVSAFRAPVTIISFLVSSNTFTETNGDVTISVRRSSVTNASVNVDYTMTDGTAMDGQDYLFINGTITFDPGETNKVITLSLLEDDIRESTETLTVSLSNPSIGTLGTSNLTVYVADNDSSTVGFASSGISVAEGTNVFTTSVVRGGATNTAVTVNYFTTNGTASAGSDYIATNGLLSFAAGQTTQTVSVVVLNDTTAENNELFYIRLRTPTNTVAAGTTNFAVTITTNDSAILSFSAATLSTNESAGAVTLTVNRTGTTNNAVTVNFTTTNVTATAGSDYTATNGTLSFAAGETSKTFTLDITDDDTLEAAEALRIVLSSPSDARLNIGTNTLSILDNDANVVGFTVATNTVSETNGTLTLTIVRTGATNTAVSVDYHTTNITATAGGDYISTNGTLSFAAGETTNTLDLALVDDATQEITETFRIRLLNATNTTIGTGTNLVTVTDDDGSTIGFTIAAISVAEETNSLTLTVVRTGATNTAATVRYSTTNTTASAPSDYIATNGLLSFAAGVTTNTFAVAVINDVIAENNETFTVRLTSPTNCSLGTSNLVVTITTNDSAILSFSVATNLVSETNGTLTFTVNRTGTTNNAVTVAFTTTNISASSSTDYSATNGTLSFAAGETSKTFTTDITDDDTQETNETFRAILSNPTDARITVGTNLVTIVDDDVSTVGFTAGTVTVSETNGTLTLTVVRTGATNTAATVDFTTTNVSAVATSDYTATNGTFTFNPGETTNTVSIAIVDDQSLETNETFRVRLFNASNTSLGTGTNTVTIDDDDVATVGFTASAISVTEDTNSVTVTVARTGATNTVVSIRYANLTTGTAAAGSDYGATNGLFVFGLGETSKTFAVNIVNDSVAENNETINLRLSNPTNTALGTTNLVITITTNDSAVLAFSVATNTVSETNGTLTFAVRRTGTTNNAVTVAFTTTNVTASSASDYSPTNGTLSFAAGETNKTFTVDLTDDDTQETNETFRVVLSNPTDARITTGTNIVTITDDDVSTVGFTVATNTVSETNSTLTLTVVRAGATNTAVTVDFATTNVTATAGSDYGATNGTFTFAPGVTTNTATIDITDNATQESTETFQVRLSNASNTSLGTGTNTVTITDDDSGSVAFTVAAVSVAENTNSVTLTVVRSGATNTAVTVNYATLTNGTAAAGSDFRTTNGLLSFAAGVTTNTFAVSIIDDAIAENNETINVRLSNPTNCSLGTSNLVLTITTNDSAVLSFTTATNLVSETNGTLTLTVLRTGTTNNAVTVAFTTTNLTASSASDYSATNGTLSFAAGETNKTFTVDLTDDDTQETNETFRVVLSNPTDARITTGTNVVTITDDDVSTVGFTVATNNVSETNGTLTLTVVRAGATNTAISVGFTTTNGTAVATSDYTATNGTLNFAAGETTNTFTLAIVDDMSLESAETFQVRLSGASNTSIGVGTNVVNITDDDQAAVGFTASAISVAEDTNSVTLTIVRTGATNTVASVRYSTTNGTAAAGSDYVATNGLFTFGLGETSKTFTLTVINDTISESNETVLVRLTNPTNTALATSNLVVTITTNDSAVLTLSTVTNTVSETNGTLTFTVARAGTTNNAVTVAFTTTNVTASSAGDYSPTNGTLSFAAGETNKTFTVDLTDDDTQETNETFRVVLSSPTDARLAAGTNIVTITDDDVSTVGFTVATNTVSETNGTLTLTVVRAGATNTAVTVDFITTNVTATAGTDYGATNGTFTFAPGVTTNLVTIDITDNATQESTETFQVRLSNASNTSVGTGTNTVTITDDDGGAVGFTVAAISVTEDTNSVTLTIVRSGATNTAVTVNYATLTNGTATAGSDFRATNGLLSFAAGVTTNTFAVAVINDAIAENNETINVRLSNPTNCSLGTSNLVLTITTNDSSVLTLSTTTNTVSETNGTLTFTVRRSGTTNNAVTVAFTTTNVTASSASDYSPTNGTLSFAAGETNKTFTVDLTDDDTQETNETFRVVLSNPVDATLGVGTNVVTITDDDVSTLAFTTNAVTVSETNGTLTLTVVRTGATNTAVSVDFATTNTTALAGSDYVATNGTLNFAPGETTNTFDLSITDNLLLENTETFQVRLSNASNTSLGTGTNTITITDDDVAAVGFVTAAISVAENTNSLTIYVVRTGTTNTTVSVNYATLTNGSATAGSDFRTTNGVLSFAPGVTTNTFALTIINDGLAENNETINLRLSSPTNMSLGTSNLTVTITTNDSAMLTLSTATNTVSETNGTLTFTVTRAGTTNNAIAVDFTTTNVTASSASDYSATNGTLSFAAGETSKTFTVDLTDDDTQETNETFRVVLSNPVDANFTVGTNTVTITDDDVSTVGFTADTSSVAETNGTLTLTVVRAGATNTTIAVDFATTNITATAGSDYGATNGTFTFAPGETTNTVTISITDNATQESTETFQMRLSNVSNSSIGTGTNAVTITDDDGSTVSFLTNAVAVAENTNAVTITVIRSGATNTAISVNYTNLASSTATAGSDFIATNGVLAFAPGVTTNTFALVVINDALPENNEFINYRLQIPTNCSLGTSNLVVTVTTNDSAVLGWSLTATNLAETNASVTLTVNRTGTTNNAVTVDFDTVNVGATSGSDYTETNGTLNFAAGETSKTITVEMSDDFTQETNETFRVVLSNPADATISASLVTITITDDDNSTVAFTTNAVTVAETNGTLTLTVIRAGATNTTVAVDFATTNITATAGSDYGATNGTFTFAPGETTNTVTIAITDNATQESTETFQVRLSNVSNSSITTGTNTVTITDDDGSTVGFTVSAISVAENTNSLTLTVVRAGATNTAVSVNYATLTSGTATSGSDFRATNGILSFAAGVTTNTFALGIIDDTTPENNETVLLLLSSATNCSLGTSNLTVTITTNDSAILSFSVATNLVSETNGTLTLTVARTGTTNNAVTVDFTTTNVTASSASDYSPTNGTLSFAAGETNKTFTVDLTDDDTQESTETFRIVLSNPVDATVATGTNTVTITDDDVSTVGFTAGTTSLAETNGALTLTVVRAGATNTAVTVDFTTTNVTAAAGSDYGATNGTFTFAPGVTTNLVTIDITDNATQESTETFQVRLGNVSNSTLVTGTNTITITDDDGSTVSFTTNSIAVAENTNVVTLTVVRSGATNTAVSVNFTNLTTGSATAGSDYTATNGLLTFAAGVTTNTFTVTIINDLVAENNETINFNLRNATNTTLVTSNLTVTITTNDSAILSWATATTNLVETGGTLTLQVNRTGTTNNAVTVDFTTTNVTATAGVDYSATNGTLSFAAGETSKTITVDVDDDDLQEANETFRVVLSNPVDGTISTGTNTFTITDDDGSTVAFTTNAVALAETNVSVTLTIVRSGATNTAVSIDFATTNITASAGSDYGATNGTFTFAPGVTTNTLTIALSDDLLYEGNESFRVTLSGITNSTLGSYNTNVVTITDNDIAYIGFAAASGSVNELDDDITVNVYRTGVTNTTVSVAYFTTNGTASAGSDYTAASGVLSFAPGQTNKTITVNVNFDFPIEANETFFIRLVNLTNAAAGTYLTNTVTITDAFGDPPPTGIVSIDSIRALDGNRLVLRITGPDNAPVLIETTTDFKTWTPVHSAVLSGGSLDWVAPINPAEPARYFRVAPPR